MPEDAPETFHAVALFTRDHRRVTSSGSKRKRKWLSRGTALPASRGERADPDLHGPVELQPKLDVHVPNRALFCESPCPRGVVDDVSRLREIIGGGSASAAPSRDAEATSSLLRNPAREGSNDCSARARVIFSFTLSMRVWSTAENLPWD